VTKHMRSVRSTILTSLHSVARLGILATISVATSAVSNNNTGGTTASLAVRALGIAANFAKLPKLVRKPDPA
jgi:hypothetical protein